jgi:hypothetical protein
MSILRDNHGRTWACWATLLVAAAIATTGTVWAEEALRIEAVRLENVQAERKGRWTTRLDGNRLVPRVSIEMESISAFHHTVQPGQTIRDHIMYSNMTDSVRRNAERMVRRAARDYLLEAVRLDRSLNRVRRSVGSKTPRTDDLSFKLGVHSMLPVVGVQYRNDAGALDVSVGASGSVGLRFRPQRFQGTQISVGFDGDDVFRIRARVGF